MEVPQELRDLNQWVVWKYIGEDKRKVPFQTDGQPAKSNDPETWTTHEWAAKSGQQLGFVFSASDGLFGIDLDSCIDASGEVQAWAMAIVARFGTYAEVSPSGNGIKLWGRGAMPGGAGKKIAVNEPNVCGKQPQIEAYDRGRYFTFTGERLPTAPLAVNDCQEALDWLVGKYWPPKMTPQASANCLVIGSTNVERARKYLAAMGPCDPRPEHPMDASTHLLKAFCVLVGFAIDDQTALALVRDWDLGNPCGPYREREYQRKLSEAKKLNRPGWLLQDKYTGNDVDLSVLLSGLVATPHGGATIEAVDDDDDEDLPKPIYDGGAFPVDAYNCGGLIADIVEYTLQRSIYPQPELALAAAIALVGTITGRKVCDQINGRTNIYVVGLCPPGGGKEIARTVNKDILAAGGGLGMIGPEDIASSAGMISVLADSPATLFQIDEIGRTIKATQNHGAQHMAKVAGYFLKLWSLSNTVMKSDAYADRTKTKEIHSPHCVLYGTSTPGAFWETLTRDNVTEGLVGRLAVFESSAGPTGNGYTLPSIPETIPIPPRIIDRVRWWCDFSPGEGNLAKANPIPVVVPWSADSKKRYQEHMLAIAERRTKGEPVEASALWSRSGEKAGKLALIFACSRSECEPPKEIALDDMERAIRLSNWLTRRMLVKVDLHVSESPYEALVKRVLGRIGDGCTANELTRRTQGIEKRMRESIIGDLISSGRVKLATVSTKGRPRTLLVKNY